MDRVTTRARGPGALLTLAFCLGLSACGGSSGPSSTASSASGSQQDATTTSAATPQQQRARLQGSASGSQSRRIPARLRREAGKAAPFLTPAGDNSIPTYGLEGSGSQRAQASRVLHAYLMGRAEEDWGKACSLLGTTPRHQLEVVGGASTGTKASCPKIYAAFAAREPASELGNPMVGAIVALRIKGEKAFALFYGLHHQQYMMPMVSEGGQWRINQVAPLAYPIGAPVGTR